MAKMRESTGGGYERRGKFYVRVTVGPQHREDKLAPWATSLEAVSERGRLVQSWVNRLRAAGADEFVERILELGAAADGQEALAKIALRVDAIAGNNFDRIEETKPASKDTFGDVSDRWTKGELARLYPDHIEKKDSVQDDIERLAYAERLREVPMRALTRARCDEVMAKLPAISKRTGRPLLPGTRRQIAQTINRVVNLSVFLGIIDHSPLPRGWVPKAPKAESTAKEGLLPSEEAKLLGGRNAKGELVVPLVFRVLYGFFDWEGMRKGEAKAFDWADINLAKGLVSLDDNKTDRPRSWVLQPPVLRLLQVWNEMQGKPKAGTVFVGITETQWHTLAELYREHCKAAGIDRARLFERKPGRKLQLRAHDMRGFFVTASRFRGQGFDWVTDRTGHTTLAMMRRYERDVRMWRELDEVLIEPDVAIPEIAAALAAADAAADSVPASAPGDNSAESEGFRRRDSNPNKRNQKTREHAGARAPSPSSARIQSEGPRDSSADPPLPPHSAAASLEQTIANVTRLLAQAEDPAIAAELVAERRELREELRAVREKAAGVASLEEARARRAR